MDIKKIRPIESSKTIRAIKASNTLSISFATIGAIAGVVFYFAPPSPETVSKIAAGLMAALTGASIMQSLYNQAARDGRLDVGDLAPFVTGGARVILGGQELSRLQDVLGYVKSGDLSNVSNLIPEEDLKGILASQSEIPVIHDEDS